jgi:hypothetical protein
MTTYQMTCSCGHVLKADGSTREEAVKKLQKQMSQDVVDAHVKQMHPGEPPMKAAQVHQMIAQNLKAAQAA